MIMGKSSKIDCPSQMDIAAVASLYSQLQGIANGAKVIIKAGDIERIDTAALQLFTAFIQDADKRKVSVEWKSPSDALIEAADLMGLKSSLNLATG